MKQLKNVIKFGEFKPSNKKDKDKDLGLKRIESDTLSDDMSGLKDILNKSIKLTRSDYEDGIEIVGINDISLDLSSIKNIKENTTIINADLGDKEVKRGDHLYISAMIKKKNISWNSMVVIKVRIVDIYQGLSILNSLK